MTGPHHSCKRFKDLIATPALPELGPKPRAGRRALAELNQLLDRFIVEADLPNAIIPLARSAALLWHDYLDESHSISQSIETAEGSFLHGIMHRRERSEEHTSELQSQSNLVCRLLLEKKKQNKN